MDASARQALIDEWTSRGRAIAQFVTAHVPADTVPIVVFDTTDGAPADDA
ncbi:MAG TPA: hypothetical protein VGC18_01160 [Lacisediminihabitans sp.]